MLAIAMRPSQDSHAPLTTTANGGTAWPPAAPYYPNDATTVSPSTKRHHHHWYYVWVPGFVAFIWFGTLLSMLVVWLARGHPWLDSMSPGQRVAYISDIAATKDLKPLFVVACCITGAGLVVSLALERWLRHVGRLHANLRGRERVFSILSILSALLGGVALILLSVFDTRHYVTPHRIFLLLFTLGVALSAIFTVVEFRWVNQSYPAASTIKRAYWMKGVLVAILIPAAVAFGICLRYQQNVGAIIEWAIAFGFTIYLLTFWYDLRASKHNSSGELRRSNLIANGYGNHIAPEIRERLATERV